LNSGFLKLFTWTKDFNPNTQQNSSAQVWMRIYGLAQEYWRPKILFSIASSVGTPICIDHITNKPRFDREFGHFVRVLVDLDLKKEPVYRVLVERVGFAFFVDFEYEKLPNFCHYCNFIGHDQSKCKRANPEKFKADETQGTKAPTQAPKKSYVAKKQKNDPTLVPVIADHNTHVIADNSNVVFDPLLDSILKNKVDASPVNIIESPLREVVKSPAPINPHNTQLVDDNCSTDSEFVDATQIDDEPDTINNIDNSKSPSTRPAIIDRLPTPDRVVQDMNFLKTSWANLADLEDQPSADDLLQLTDEIQNSNDSLDAIPVSNQFMLLDNEEPFQQVVSKKKGKNANTASKKAYSTRAKASSSNLVK
jgi:hypothetical protein